ncbi:hypothetical protein HDU85_006392 [Gaertneriomyces sp. JEL0708]|nr:hypothetical protein HDU85_006392 [Gaertneriomyces sp. JEL0708]
MQSSKELPDFLHYQVEPPSQSKRRRRCTRFTLISILVFLVYLVHYGLDGFSSARDWISGAELTSPDRERCPQQAPLEPRHRSNLTDTNRKLILEDATYRNQSVKRMSGAIQVATQSFDDMGPVDKDPRWDIFAKFEAYLRETFPEVHERLEVAKVNTYGLVYTWQGKDSSLKPILLAAHQDVVPVPQETTDRWTYPPFDGYFDGEWIWGRGAGDCKNNLIGILEAVEILVKANFEPNRTVVLGFGFDEEVGGDRGARHISAYLEKTYGRDGFAAIVDEGGLGIGPAFGDTIFALPATGEKGYVDIVVTVDVPGGHSSVPPDHTGIGVLADVIKHLESNPDSPHLTSRNPYLSYLQCAAEHSDGMTKWMRKAILLGKKLQKVADALSAESRVMKSQMQTTQAVDVIRGGVKVNALPERSEVMINYRIAVESSVDELKEKFVHLVKKKAQKYNLMLDAFGDKYETRNVRWGTMRLSTREALNPAPVSPMTSDAYAVLAGTVKHTFGRDVVVAPTVMTGNTDTKYYWNLTRDIYRFSPVRSADKYNIHTVDERVSISGHLEGVWFYHELIRNFDEHH